jgi:hypothetical protein
MTASTGFVGRGTVLKIGDGASPEVFSTVVNVSNINITGRTANEVDFTHLASSSGYAEFRQGTKDPGEISMTVHFDPAAATHGSSGVGILALFNAGTLFNFKIDFAGAGKSYMFTGTGYYSGDDITIGPDDPVTRDVTIRVSGPLTQAASA